MSSAQAEIRDHISGNINVANNFTYRGISRHSHNKAIYGNLKYVSENGQYVGIWMGNYKPLWSDEPDTETDLYIGFRYDLKFDHNIDVSIWRGTYNENTLRDYDWLEFQASYRYQDRLRFTFAISDNRYGSDDQSAFAEVSFVHQINLLSIVLSAGTQQFDSRNLSDVTYLQVRFSLDRRNWHLFQDNSFTDIKSDSAFFSQNWAKVSNEIGLAYTF